MTLLKRLTFFLLIVGVFVIAAYLFVWIMIALLIAVPFVYLWWRWRVRNIARAARRRREAFTVEPTHHLPE